MKKKGLLFLAASFFAGSAAFAQGNITLTTELDKGTEVKILLNSKSATTPVSIDWGNGIEQKYTIDPSQAAYQRWITATVEGETIKINGFITEISFSEVGLTSAVLDGCADLKEVDLSKNKLESFELRSIMPIEQLNLSDNCIFNSAFNNPTLSLEYAGETLWSLSLSKNTELGALDIRDLVALKYFNANDCPKLGSVFICAPEESRPNMQQINLNNCDLAHFYPISMPSLTSLSLANNNLMTVADTDPFRLGDYPKLHSLNISGNNMIADIDLTKCPELTDFSASDCRLTSIDVSQNPELIILGLRNNQIAAVDLGNNKSIQSLYLTGNPIKQLDFTNLTSLQNIDIAETQIARANLHNLFFLKQFVAYNTNLEFVDFNGAQARRMTLIDLRNNKKMTLESVNYTLHTFPEGSDKTAKSRLLIEGTPCPVEAANYITGSDMNWQVDVTPQGSAPHNDVNITFEGATLTGQSKTGTHKLYPNFGMEIEYDLAEFQTEGGKFVVAQPKAPYYQHINSVTDKAKSGIPFYIYTYPDEGKRFKSLTVNGNLVNDNWAIVYDNANVKVNFSGLESSISFTTNPGQELSFLVNTVENNGTVYVDWGTGVRTEYANQNAHNPASPDLKGTRIDGSAAGSTITIYGDIAALNLEGFGDVAEYFGLWDNHVSSIDLSNCPDLKNLNLYWNPISSIDLSAVPELQVLDVSFTNLKSLDLSKVPNLLWLDAYSDGFYDEESGIRPLTEIDVTANPLLQYLNVKNNELTSLDLSKNSHLYDLNVANNKLTGLDVTSNPNLMTLNAQGNLLTSIDVSKNNHLYELTLSNNNIKTLDLKENKELVTLMFDNNDIHAIDLSMLPALKQLYLNGNTLSADELNDIYYMLPQRRPDEEADNDGMQTSWNLAVIQGGDKDGQANDGLRADSSIAVDRGWTPSHIGSNGGSEFAYLDILSSPHGTLTVKDADGKVYSHGSKVKKYAPLTIVAQPEEGYTMTSFTLNGENPSTGDSFEMPGIYTKLRATFAKTSGLEAINAEGLNILAGNGCIVINTNGGQAHLRIYNMNGVMMFDGMVDNNSIIPVDKGIYVAIATEEGIKKTARLQVK